METNNIHRLIEHALNLKPDSPLAEQHHRIDHKHLHGEEEEAADAEYDFADDTTEEDDE